MGGSSWLQSTTIGGKDVFEVASDAYIPDAHVRELGSLENFGGFFLSSQHDNGCVAVLAGCVGLG